MGAPASSAPGHPGLKRSLSVRAAVDVSVAQMAPSTAANINPQARATTAGRAVPLTFLIAAVGVLLSVEGTTVSLILMVTAVVLVRLLAGKRAGPRALHLERVPGGAGHQARRPGGERKTEWRNFSPASPNSRWSITTVTGCWAGTRTRPRSSRC